MTGVGGTRLTLDNEGGRSAETVWNDGTGGFSPAARGAGGGGISHFWPMPEWQLQAITPARGFSRLTILPGFCTLNLATGGYCREVPDVSADADPASGVIVYADGTWTHVGGTSAGAPQWAGLTALVDSCAAGWGLRPLGFINPALYRIADDPVNYAAAFNDITQGDNDYAFPALPIFGHRAGPGYDMASGLGAPNAGGPHGVVLQLCAQAPRTQ